MGLAELFSFKSKAEREREARAYEKWAFPYGQPQREKVSAILKELLPEEPGSAALAVFLMGKEGYVGSVKEDPDEVAAKSEEKKLKRIRARVDNLLPGKKKKKLISRYVALIIADSKVDESLNYPSVQELRKSAQVLEPVLDEIVV